MMLTLRAQRTARDADADGPHFGYSSYELALQKRIQRLEAGLAKAYASLIR